MYFFLIKLFWFVSFNYVCVWWCVSLSVMSDLLQPHELQPTRIHSPWNSPGKNTGVSGYSLVLMALAMLNKFLIQFSADGWDCVPSLLFGLRPSYGRGNEGNGDLLKKDLYTHCCLPDPAAGYFDPHLC